jgi:alkylation response protein AidB-like acyl-CoA dehydrogenase
MRGGCGFVEDSPVQEYYREAKLCTIGEGITEIQRLVMARMIVE